MVGWCRAEEREAAAAEREAAAVEEAASLRTQLAARHTADAALRLELDRLRVRPTSESLLLLNDTTQNRCHIGDSGKQDW